MSIVQASTHTFPVQVPGDWCDSWNSPLSWYSGVEVNFGLGPRLLRSVIPESAESETKAGD